MMNKLRNIRNNFLKMRGGNLISIESVILAFVVLFILTMIKNTSPYFALVIAFIVGFAFPILVGTFKSSAWIAAILFSLLWAMLGFITVIAVTDGTLLPGLLTAFVIFAIGFVVHKNYSGFSFRNISRKVNTNITIDNSVEKENVIFCPKCGRRISTADGKCDICDK